MNINNFQNTSFQKEYKKSKNSLYYKVINLKYSINILYISILYLFENI